MVPTTSSSKSTVSAQNTSGKNISVCTRSTSVLTQLISEKNIWLADSSESSNSLLSFAYSEPARVQSSPLSRETIPFQVPEIDDLLPEKGLARKTIHEIFYKDPLQPYAVACTLSTIIACNAYLSSRTLAYAHHWHNSICKDTLTPSIIWIGSRCWPSPLTLSSYCAHSHFNFLQQCLFIDPPNDKATLWAIETALRSRAVQLVIACCPKISRSITQRLALSARNHNSTAILLRHIDDSKEPSHALSRWEVAPTPSHNDLPSWNLTLCRLPGLSAQKYSWRITLRDSWDTLLTSASDQASVNLLHAIRIDAHTSGTLQAQSAQNRQRAGGLSL